MQYGGQNRHKIHPARRNRGKRHLWSGWRTFDGAVGGRYGPRLDYPMAKRTERHRFGPGSTSVFALSHPDLVKFDGLDAASDAQGLAKAP